MESKRGTGASDVRIAPKLDVNQRHVYRGEFRGTIWRAADACLRVGSQWFAVRLEALPPAVAAINSFIQRETDRSFGHSKAYREVKRDCCVAEVRDAELRARRTDAALRHLAHQRVQIHMGGIARDQRHDDRRKGGDVVQERRVRVCDNESQPAEVVHRLSVSALRSGVNVLGRVHAVMGMQSRSHTMARRADGEQPQRTARAWLQIILEALRVGKQVADSCVALI